jgi:hypothetical protein
MRLGPEPKDRATLQICDRHEARALWNEAERFLQDSIGHGIGDLDEDDLRRFCFDGAATLLIFTGPYADIVGAGVTQLLRHPDGRMVLKLLAFGADNFEMTRHCLAIVEADGKSKGAQAVQFHGRPGWKRVCGPMGYDVKQVIMEKVLPGGNRG